MGFSIFKTRICNSNSWDVGILTPLPPHLQIPTELHVYQEATHGYEMSPLIDVPIVHMYDGLVCTGRNGMPLYQNSLACIKGKLFV